MTYLAIVINKPQPIIRDSSLKNVEFKSLFFRVLKIRGKAKKLDEVWEKKDLISFWRVIFNITRTLLIPVELLWFDCVLKNVLFLYCKNVKL